MNRIEWLGLLVFIAISYTPFIPYPMIQRKSFAKWHMTAYTSTRSLPPLWFIVSGWSLIHVLIALSLFWYWQGAQGFVTYDATLYAAVVSLLCNKLQYPMLLASSTAGATGKFFQMLAVLSAIGGIASGAFVEYHFGIASMTQSAILYVFYLAWMLHVLIYSVEILFVME